MQSQATWKRHICDANLWYSRGCTRGREAVGYCCGCRLSQLATVLTSPWQRVNQAKYVAFLVFSLPWQRSFCCPAPFCPTSFNWLPQKICNNFCHRIAVCPSRLGKRVHRFLISATEAGRVEAASQPARQVESESCAHSKRCLHVANIWPTFALRIVPFFPTSSLLLSSLYRTLMA